MKIKAFLIDDERKALAILRNKLERYCPQLEIVGESQNPKEAITQIEQLQPDLVFLDIAMPEMTGFEMLEAMIAPNFEVIFVTAFDEYAVDAIRHCAIGYIVKPADKDDLIAAVDKATANIEQKQSLEKNKQLIANLGVQSFHKKKIIVPTQKGLEFIPVPTIIRCEGVDGYTNIHLEGGQKMMSSNSIGHFAKMLDSALFYQIHKSHIINLDHINSYLNEGYVYLTEQHRVPVARNKRASFINALRGD